MAVQTYPGSEPRRPWNRAQLLRAAIDLADKGGIESLSMRKLSQELGGGTMSLYNHVLQQGRPPRRHDRHPSSARSNYPPASTTGRQTCGNGHSRSARS